MACIRLDGFLDQGDCSILFLSPYRPGQLTWVRQELAYSVFCLSERFSGCVIRRHFACTPVWSAREKSFEILRHCRELNPGYEGDRRWDTFILSLSYHGLGYGEDGQWDAFILTLSYHDPGHGEGRQCDTFILTLSYHSWLRSGWWVKLLNPYKPNTSPLDTVSWLTPFPYCMLFCSPSLHIIFPCMAMEVAVAQEWIRRETFHATTIDFLGFELTTHCLQVVYSNYWEVTAPCC